MRKDGKMNFPFSLRRGTALMLAGVSLLLMLSGCHKEKAEISESQDSAAVQAQSALDAAGDPHKVTCKAGYTVPQPQADAAAAQVDGDVLTNGVLNIFYHLTVNNDALKNPAVGPDFAKPLNSQTCTIAGGNLTWEQYFLDQALELWHGLKALERKSREITFQHEKNFEVVEQLHRDYMPDMPIEPVLYGQETTFQLSKLQREYFKMIPRNMIDLAKALDYQNQKQMLETEFGPGTARADLEAAVNLLNYAYMYIQELSYDLVPSEELVAEWLQRPAYETTERTVSFRHILFRPEGAGADSSGRVKASPEQWEKLDKYAKQFLRDFQNNRPTEGKFAAHAHDYSMDSGSRLDGGLYSEVHRGQMTNVLDKWCFDPDRKPGDTAVLRSDFGIHLVYFKESRNANARAVETEFQRDRLNQALQQALEDYPMEVDYSVIQLGETENSGRIRISQHLLYPDVGHERFPEVPVYIQQDYKKAPYGAYKVSSHGCGISAMAMLSTYMTDEVLTPGGLAARYGSYNGEHGTDQMLFTRVPPELGFYLEKRTNSWEEVEKAMKQGKKAISLQVKGYFTRGGHYLVLSDLTPDGQVVLRDSNLYNYKRLPEHKQDAFKPGKLFPNGQGLWIYDNKVVTIPSCSRCGTPENMPQLLNEDYLCRKCQAATMRRDNFLKLLNIQ